MHYKGPSGPLFFESQRQVVVILAPLIVRATGEGSNEVQAPPPGLELVQVQIQTGGWPGQGIEGLATVAQGELELVIDVLQLQDGLQSRVRRQGMREQVFHPLFHHQLKLVDLQLTPVVGLTDRFKLLHPLGFQIWTDPTLQVQQRVGHGVLKRP